MDFAFSFNLRLYIEVMGVIMYLATSGRVTVSQDEIHEVMHKVGRCRLTPG
jgi:hypothetical protein